MARATLVCCVLSVFVICLLLFFCCFFVCLLLSFFCFVLFCFVFFLGGGVVVLFCCCFVMVFIWLVLDALDLVRNTKKEFCANRICAHKGPQGKRIVKSV